MRHSLRVATFIALLLGFIALAYCLRTRPAEATPLNPHIQELLLAQAEVAGGGSDACTGQACSVTSLSTSGVINTTVASGSNMMTMLDGARLKFSSTDSNGYMRWNTSLGGIDSPGILGGNRFYPGSTPGVFLGAGGTVTTKPQISPALDIPFTDDSANAGDRTVNKGSGKSAIALGASAAVITDSEVGANSRIFLTPLDVDATCINWKAVPASGSFTVTTNTTCTAIWKFQWLVIGG